MSARTAPRYSTRELQAAANALAAGRFSTAAARTEMLPVSDSIDSTPSVTAEGVGDRHEADTVGTPRPIATSTLSSGSVPLVRVRAANAGAGASTITLALADVADAAGIRTRVLDAAAPTWSGLLGATVTELGAAEGWRRGRRGDGVLIDRIEKAVNGPAEVPSPRSVDGVDLTVLDAGWSMRELGACAAGAWVATTPAAAEVLVTRPHGLALSQTEAVLFAPLLPAKVLPGLGPDPLPKQLTSPSQRLLERVTTITGPLTANRT